MNCKLVISQPAPNAPEGKPYGVSHDDIVMRNNRLTRWFATESQAWDYRDMLLDSGYRGVRVVGAPCNAFVTM